MSNAAENERLLREILDEETPAANREALLQQMLCVARRRRRIRQARMGVVGAAVLVLAVFALRSFTPVPSPRTIARPESQPAKNTFEVFATQPLRPEAYVHSSALAVANVVSSTAAVQTISTAASGSRPREIGDEELLDLAAPNPVVLVRNEPHQAELVFIGQGQEKE